MLLFQVQTQTTKSRNKQSTIQAKDSECSKKRELQHSPTVPELAGDSDHHKQTPDIKSMPTKMVPQFSKFNPFHKIHVRSPNRVIHRDLRTTNDRASFDTIEAVLKSAGGPPSELHSDQIMRSRREGPGFEEKLIYARRDVCARPRQLFFPIRARRLTYFWKAIVFTTISIIETNLYDIIFI